MSAVKGRPERVFDLGANILIAGGFLVSTFAHSDHWMFYFGLLCLMTVIRTGSDHIVAELRAGRRAKSATVTQGVAANYGMAYTVCGPCQSGEHRQCHRARGGRCASGECGPQGHAGKQGRGGPRS